MAIAVCARLGTSVASLVHLRAVHVGKRCGGGEEMCVCLVCVCVFGVQLFSVLLTTKSLVGGGWLCVCTLGFSGN